MKKDDRMWRERMQVIDEYFNSRIHQIVQLAKNGRMWRIQAVFEHIFTPAFT
jgi:hypothetical protein